VFYFSRGEQVVLAVLMLALLAGVGVLLYNQGQASAGTDQPFLVDPAVGREDTGVILVHVAGEVHRPGVYRLKIDSRVRDAIAAAGGPTAKADVDALNLAARVGDEQKIQVPAREPASANPSSGSSPSAEPPTPPSPISINHATEQELEALPGIGPTYARRIVERRRELQRTQGRAFTSLEELMEVPGIGPKRFAQIKPYLRL
jgi:competence protein ComEA